MMDLSNIFFQAGVNWIFNLKDGTMFQKDYPTNTVLQTKPKENLKTSVRFALEKVKVGDPQRSLPRSPPCELMTKSFPHEIS